MGADPEDIARIEEDRPIKGEGRVGEHTPTPWADKTAYLGHPNNRRNIIIGLKGYTNNIARVFSPDATLPGMTSQGPDSREEAEANARYIVRAVNSHADLQEALPDPDKLELLADWFDNVQKEQPDRWGEGHEVQDDLRRWAARARVAITAPADSPMLRSIATDLSRWWEEVGESLYGDDEGLAGLVADADAALAAHPTP